MQLFTLCLSRALTHTLVRFYTSLRIHGRVRMQNRMCICEWYEAREQTNATILKEAASKAREKTGFELMEPKRNRFLAY